MAITFKTDIVEEALSRLLEQFKGKPNIEGLLSAYSAQVQDLEDMYEGLLDGRMLANAVGAQLDLLGELVGAPRNGLSDSDYRVIITSQIATNKSNGTIEELISIIDANIVVATGGSQVINIQERQPATIYITTSGTLTPDIGQRVGNIVKKARAGGVASFFVHKQARPFRFSTTGLPLTPSPTQQGFGSFPAVPGTGGMFAGVVGGPC